MNNPHTHVNTDVYATRMASADDKALLAAKIPEHGSILDFGCGAGALVPYLDAAGIDVADRYTGFDSSSAMIEAARLAHPGVHFENARVNLDLAGYDTIVLSSVIHEVVAYAEHRYPDPGRHIIAARFLGDAIARSLLTENNPNNLIAVRDGVAARPDRGDIVSYQLKDDVDARYFIKAAATHGRDFSHLYAHGWLTGPHREVADFLNLYTWGWESLPREVHETVNVFSEAGWRRVATEANLTVSSFETYSQPDYFTHLNQLVDLDGDTWDTKILMTLRLD